MYPSPWCPITGHDAGHSDLTGGCLEAHLSPQALCFLQGADLNQSTLVMVCGAGGGVFQEILKKYIQGSLSGASSESL